MKGKCHVFGDNIDTDAIIPARYLNTSDPEELAKHCMEDADPTFVSRVRPGDLIVAGENFGCGSSREHAPVSIKGAGISCVIAKSCARIFFRNAINVGLPIIESAKAAEALKEGDEADVDLAAGKVTAVATGETFEVPPFPEELQRIMRAGGLMKYLQESRAS